VLHIDYLLHQFGVLHWISEDGGDLILIYELYN